MAISEPFPEYRPRQQPQGYRRAVQLSTTSLPLRGHTPGTNNIQSSLPTSWEHVSQPIDSHLTSNHRATLSDGFASYPQSPAPARLLSPGGLKEESVSPAGFPLYFRDAQREAMKRKSEDYDGSSDVPSSSAHSFLPYHQSISQSLASGSRQTRSLTPDLGESSICSKRPRMSLPQDVITEKLNQLRTTQNKRPLPLLEGLSTPTFLSKATPEWANQPKPHNDLYQQSQPPQGIRKRRTRSLDTTHCNIKYHVEELDYIRYHRVDLGLKWSLVESKFRTMFPMAAFSVVRKAGGLQGVNYRQNKFLPHINEAGELVFMENGHVEPVCIPTRLQTEKKHLYTLVYLFPERTITYPWVSPINHQHARKLSVGRHLQMEQGRREAKARGTYIQHLPSDAPCGCCPGEDRERGKLRRPGPKTLHKKRRSHYHFRAKL
ncbi:hypothetical protein F5B18DRAFT_346833 [Nemania serpens]|nr:hypothetical protein F5B18DRAFT_346833 [Nemania serpens]